MRRIVVIFIFLLFILQEIFLAEGALGYDEIKTYNIKGENVKINIFEFEGFTDLEGRLEEPVEFYSLKFRYLDNFFGFNVPRKTYERLSEKEKRNFTVDLLGLFMDAFSRFSDISGRIPEGYKFNVTFGQTKPGHPFNRVYLYTKTSNIFPDFSPYERKDTPFNDKQKYIMLHEIGHSLLSITVGSFLNSKTKAIEEGVVDYIAGEGFEGVEYEQGIKQRIYISQGQADNMRGLTQLDVDASIWGRKIASMPLTRAKGYVGVTHHMFGAEFINSFIEVFGKEYLLEFLKRLKASENKATRKDFGTQNMRKILIDMGFGKLKIEKFQKVLHNRLKNNIFIIREE